MDGATDGGKRLWDSVLLVGVDCHSELHFTGAEVRAYVGVADLRVDAGKVDSSPIMLSIDDSSCSLTAVSVTLTVYGTCPTSHLANRAAGGTML